MANTTSETDVGELEITDELIAERRAEQPGETPEDMTPWQRPITAFIDVMNLWAGRIFCLLVIPLIFAAVYEVVSRTAFGMLAANDMADTARAWGLGPTLWVYDVSRMLGEANMCYVSQDFQQAIRMLEEVVRRVPRVSDPYHTLGLVYEEMDDQKRALECYLIAAYLTGKDV